MITGISRKSNPAKLSTNLLQLKILVNTLSRCDSNPMEESGELPFRRFFLTQG